MKLIKILSIVGIIAGLTACNTGSTSSTGSVSIVLNPNQLVIGPTQSKATTATYSGSSGSSAIGQTLYITPLSGYTITNTCGSTAISTTSASCSITVMCTQSSGTCPSGTIYICPSNQTSSCSSYNPLTIVGIV